MIFRLLGLILAYIAIATLVYMFWPSPGALTQNSTFDIPQDATTGANQLDDPLSSGAIEPARLVSDEVAKATVTKEEQAQLVLETQNTAPERVEPAKPIAKPEPDETSAKPKPITENATIEETAHARNEQAIAERIIANCQRERCSEINFTESFVTRMPKQVRDARHITDVTFGPLMSDLEALKGLRNIKKVIGGPTIETLDPFVDLLALHEIEIKGAEIADIEPLRNLASLEFLILANSKIKDLGPISGAFGLRHLDVNGSQISSVTPLTRLHDLETLNLSGTALAQFDLPNARKITALNLSNTPLVEMPRAANLPALRKLDISGTSVSRLFEISKMTQLEYLSMTQLHRVDASELRGMASLKHIDLRGTGLIDWAVLLEIPNLETVKIETIEPAANKTISELIQRGVVIK